MKNKSQFQYLHRTSEYVIKLAYINAIWFLSTVLGLGVLGFFPATSALFGVVRQWLVKGIEDVPIWKTFWNYYSNEFIRINVIGYIFLAIGWTIFYNLKFFQSQYNSVLFLLSYVYLSALFLCLLMFLFLFPTFVHYNLRKLQYLKQTLLIVLSNPLDVVATFVSLLLIFFLMNYIPILIPFFLISGPSLIIMRVSLKIFKKYRK